MNVLPEHKILYEHKLCYLQTLYFLSLQKVGEDFPLFTDTPYGQLLHSLLNVSVKSCCLKAP